MAFGRPLRTSFSRSHSGGYALEELSPHPDDSLLVNEQHFEDRNPSTSPRPSTSLTDRSDTSRRDSETSARSDGSGTSRDNGGKLKAVANAYPTSRRGAAVSRMSQLRGPDLWRPPFTSFGSESPDQNRGSHDQSWLGSILRSRPISEDNISYAPPAPQRMPKQMQRPSSRAAPADVDSSFTVLRRREHDITRQIQYYLSQQEKAHESSPMGQMASQNPAKTTDSQPDPLYESEASAYGHVVPVRQPKKGPISLRRARNGITNSIAMMADLKAEEDAQVAEAVALRKKALAKLQSMQSRMSSIDHDLGVMQDTTTNPARKTLREKREQYTGLCKDIKSLEEQLRQARLEKGIMERQMEELQSKLDSDISGYQGAKRECEQGLKDLMGHPGVPALDVKDLGFKDWHEIGLKFLEQPRSKRRPDMAKEWWEGDLRFLEEYRRKLETERSGLEEGGQLWLDAVAKITSYEQRLSKALGMDTAGSKSSQWSNEQTDPKILLLDFYHQMGDTIRELEGILTYSESEGMTLLVAAIGAEVMAMQSGKDVFSNLIKSQGWELPEESRSTTPTTNGNENLLDVRDDNLPQPQQESSQQSTQYHDADEELSGSVIRRWEEPTTETLPQSRSLRGSQAQLVSQGGSATEESKTEEVPERRLSPLASGATDHGKGGIDVGGIRDDHSTSSDHEDDNEVPAGLLSEIHLRPEEDSGDEQRHSQEHDDNAVPKEFLSMHE
ncbi:structural maintenance of chromosome 4 [Microdochium nivale]|nr:structural maintenance of chromosome 4 [Microdochium nivale]